MNNIKRKIEYLNINDITPYEKNPRKNDKSVEYVKNSIEEFGFNVPIVIDKENKIVCGHTRYKAAKKLGITEVPTIKVDELTDDQVKAFRLADNKVSESSEWDLGLLFLEKKGTSLDLKKFGFLDEEEKVAIKGDKTVNLKEMELQAFEHYDYIVFIFRNQFDWLNIINEFGIEDRYVNLGNCKKIGLGRIIEGEELIKKIRHQSNNS